MFISKISEVSNYRNLSGQEVIFDNQINFLIGENNIGKTNLLELLSRFFSTGKFSENDFNCLTEPIKVKVSISYHDDEIGFFEDNFDVDDSNTITIIGVQSSVDERIEYYHDTPCMSKISPSVIKKLNFLYYYAQRMPSKEMDFRKTNGSGKVLNFLIQSSLDNAGIQESDLVDTERIGQLLVHVNDHISKLNTITGDGISAYLDNTPEKILSRMLGLGDTNGRDLSLLGEGVQYAFNILLQIVDTIHNVKCSRKAEDFESRLVCIKGKKLFPMILLLDEPEIHQHPYRQRSLIKKISSIMNNENQDFLSLLSSLFGIDGLIGQIFIATHSPNILLQDYAQFIRIHMENGNMKIVSGKTLSISEEKIYKHMLRNFAYLKEAMFSRGVIFVEGDTEAGAMPVFADRLGYDLDEQGVGIIKLDGADSVLACIDLFEKFGIKSVAVIDKDKESSYGGNPQIIFTDSADFESDIYDSTEFLDYLRCCIELEMVKSFISPLKREIIDFDARQFVETPLDIDIPEEIARKIKLNERDKQLEQLKKSKNAVKGTILATHVTRVPNAYEQALVRVFKVSDND